MSNITEQYLELVKLTRQHLQLDYSSQKFITLSEDAYKHFSKLAPSVPILKTMPVQQQPMAAPPFQAAPSPLNTPPRAQQAIEIRPNEPPLTTSLIETASILPPASETRIKPSKNDSSLTLHPLDAASKADFREVKQILAQHIPDYSTIEDIPEDHVAKSINSAWKQTQTVPSILILAFNDSEKHQLFLHNIAAAISICIAPAQVISASKIEQNLGWEEFLKNSRLRLVISSDYGIYTLPELMKHFKENPKQGKNFLGTVPLLLLSDLSLYLKEPKLKPLLWRSIISEIGKKA